MLVNAQNQHPLIKGEVELKKSLHDSPAIMDSTLRNIERNHEESSPDNRS